MVFLSKFKLLIEKREFCGNLKNKSSISATGNDTKKILTQIENRTFQVLQNANWIPSLFESVPMDKVKTNGFYV